MLYNPKLDRTLKAKVLEPWQACLFKAANHLRRYGWIQHHTITEDGAACALGAINAQGNDQAVWTATFKLSQHLGTDNVARWNDTPGRTKEQVIAALEACALSSGGQG